MKKSILGAATAGLFDHENTCYSRWDGRV